MLTIRQAQVDALARSVRERFEVRLETDLRAAFPMQTAPLHAAEMRALIRAGIARAGEYQVILEPDVRRYLEFVLCYGPEFDTSEKTLWAGEILRATDVDGTEKINRLDEYELFVLGGGPA